MFCYECDASSSVCCAGSVLCSAASHNQVTLRLGRKLIIVCIIFFHGHLYITSKLGFKIELTLEIDNSLTPHFHCYTIEML